MRRYYNGMSKLRADLLEYLERDQRHHIYLSTVMDVVESDADPY